VGQEDHGAVRGPPPEPAVEGPWRTCKPVMRLREPVYGASRQPERWRLFT